MHFFIELIRELVNEGHSVDIATNEEISKVPIEYREMGCAIHHIDCERSPFARGNVRAVAQIRELVDDGGYDIVHCHTPVAAACTRLACRGARRHGARVIYTAHGFHFYAGAPLRNWLLYFPVEWALSWVTDVLITINHEDYDRARRHLHARRTEYVPGVGVDLEKFRESGDGERIRKEFGIGDKFMLLSVGELNENKNHAAVIEAIVGLDLVYVIVGRGELESQLRARAEKLGVHVILTGFRSDVVDFYAAANAYILPSLREGLNVSLMEAMASGLPVMCLPIRGNIDLVRDEESGLLVENEPGSIAKGISRLMENPELTYRLAGASCVSIGEYGFDKVIGRTRRIYKQR